MGLFEAYKFVEKAAMSYMGKDIERMKREFKRNVQQKSNDELRKMARNMEQEENANPQLMAIVREEMQRRGLGRN